MTVESEVANLTTSVDALTASVNVSKATLDASVADAESAQTGSQAARDTASLHKLAAEAAATSATNTASALTGFDLAAIAETKSVTAVNVFVYDTANDSDGGKWRKRTQATSWYNEALNTATRGARKEFPAVAVIVAESNKVTIYDGDDPAMPMWRVFKRDTNTTDSGKAWWRDASGITAGSIFAAQGKLCIGLVGAGSSSTTLLIADFAVDDLIRYSDSSNSSNRGLPISASNNNPELPINFAVVIVSDNINDVAMTVLPNAPIDATTGLPVPTIAVATDDGVSVIKDDGTVVNSSNTTNRTDALTLDGNNNMYLRYGNSIGVYIPYPNWLTDNFSYAFKYDNAVWVPTRLPTRNPQAVMVGTSNSSAAVAVVGGLDRILINESAYGNSMLSSIAANYNTGYQVGDIKLATLSDTDDTDAVGTELVTNGTFASDSSWTKGTGWTIAAGVAVATSAPQNASISSTAFTTVAGKQYAYSFEVTDYTAGSFRVVLRGAGTLLVGTIFTAAGVYEGYFTADSSSSTIELQARGVSATTLDLDNISVRLAEADRSVNGNGLQVFGTITKEPVATGADLVAYSGFSASNYLEQPYNSDLDFGTGDFSIMGWCPSAANGTILERGDGTTVLFKIDTSAGNIRWSVAGVTGDISYEAKDGDFMSLVRRSGVVSFSINGVLVDTKSATGSLSDADSVLRLGLRVNGVNPNGGSLALFRISATAPSPEQIAKMYNDEKVLFQENAQATLYGTSDAVTALAHDDTTDLLHVGTSAGRSVFQGLRRVSNTTDAVGTAISASNNLVVEE